GGPARTGARGARPPAPCGAARRFRSRRRAPTPRPSRAASRRPGRPAPPAGGARRRAQRGPPPRSVGRPSVLASSDIRRASPDIRPRLPSGEPHPKIERVSPTGPGGGPLLDELIQGGTLVDGTGAPGRRADVGVREGRIVAVAEPGTIDEAATETVDAEGLVVCPGFVDPHTHYDAQLFWDPLASPSTVHGVTTIANGNCGFTLAPLAEQDADYLRRMMARVEGMPLPALENGVPWNWSTFGDYLDRLDGKVAVNTMFNVGHCALRRNVMGPDAVGNEATPAQIDEMVRLLHESVDAGGIGFSTTLAFTHSDGDGQPVASRWASKEE